MSESMHNRMLSAADAKARLRKERELTAALEQWTERLGKWFLIGLSAALITWFASVPIANWFSR